MSMWSSGPVRTGKSTFIKRFMDLLVIPHIDNVYDKERSVMNYSKWCRKDYHDD